MNRKKTLQILRSIKEGNNPNMGEDYCNGWDACLDRVISLIVPFKRFHGLGMIYTHDSRREQKFKEEFFLWAYIKRFYNIYIKHKGLK